MSEETLLRLDGVSMVYENSPGMLKKKQRIGAVLDLDLDIAPGEIIALVGESGCGKTTIGKMICGIEHPTSGRVLYKGQDIAALRRRSPEYREYRLGVQMVHQDSYAALNPTRTIFQSLVAPIMAHGLAEDRLEALEKLVELFTLVGLTPPEDYLFKYPHQLSGGQRQRVLLARALSVKPRLIVADEPVSMVDVSLRISLLDLMGKMNRDLGISFVYITHDLATARYIAREGRILVMYLGRLVEVGPLNEVLLHPRHPYLQALISAIPMIGARVDGRKSKLLLRNVDLPDNTRPPEGCRFHPRCLYCQQECERSEPALRSYGGGSIACHRAAEIPEWEWEQ